MRTSVAQTWAGFIADGAGKVARASRLQKSFVFSFCSRHRARTQARRLRYFMFTGIVEEAGVIEKITPTKKSIEMTVRAGVCGRGVKVGDSVAVNGC